MDQWIIGEEWNCVQWSQFAGICETVSKMIYYPNMEQYGDWMSSIDKQPRWLYSRTHWRTHSHNQTHAHIHGNTDTHTPTHSGTDIHTPMYNLGGNRWNFNLDPPSLYSRLPKVLWISIDSSKELESLYTAKTGHDAPRPRSCWEVNLLLIQHHQCPGIFSKRFENVRNSPECLVWLFGSYNDGHSWKHSLNVLIANLVFLWESHKSNMSVVDSYF